MEEISAKETRGANFGLLRTMDNLGAVCGIIICILFVNRLGYRNLFLIAAAPSAIGAFLIFSLIKEKRAEGAIYKGISFKNISRDFKLFIFLSAIFALGSFSYSFLLVYAKETGFRIAFVPVLYLIFTACAAAFSLPFGRLADKIGRKPVLMISFILWGFVFICLIFFLNYLSLTKTKIIAANIVSPSER